MIQITETISFDETKTIQEQSPEFQQWFSDNCPINDKTPVAACDEYDRPYLYEFLIDGKLNISVSPNYIFPDSSNWGISGYTISIN